MKEKPYYTCPNCQKLFQYSYNNKKQKHCSPSCHISSNNKNRVWKESSKEKIATQASARYKGKDNPNYKGGGIDCTCELCKKDFKVPKGQMDGNKNSGKYCSLDCYHRYRAMHKRPSSAHKRSKEFARFIIGCLKSGKEPVKSKWVALMPYNVSQLRNHIENRFEKGMTWENHGEWHIDHVMPISYFEFQCEHDVGFWECWALRNLQPLWAFDNLSKGGKNTKHNQKLYGK